MKTTTIAANLGIALVLAAGLAASAAAQAPGDHELLIDVRPIHGQPHSYAFVDAGQRIGFEVRGLTGCNGLLLMAAPATAIGGWDAAGAAKVGFALHDGSPVFRDEVTVPPALAGTALNVKAYAIRDGELIESQAFTLIVLDPYEKGDQRPYELFGVRRGGEPATGKDEVEEGRLEAVRRF